MDLIKTIEEDAQVQDFSEDSDAEVEVNLGLNLLFFSLKKKKIYHVFRFSVFSINQQKCDARKKKNSVIILNLYHRSKNTITIHGMI